MLAVFIREVRERCIFLLAAKQKCVLDYKWLSRSEIASLILVLEIGVTLPPMWL